MDTSHRVAVYERSLLGGAAAAFAIVLSLAAKDGALDAYLCAAMALSLAALPVLLALYVAKDAIENWIAEESPSSQRSLTRTTWAASFGMTGLAASIACLAGHIFGWFGALFAILWLMVVVGRALRADQHLGRGTER
jgi:hypothetical protein